MRHIHDQDLQLFAAGSLHGGDLLRVDAHLAECHACRRRALQANIHESPFEEVDSLINQAETSGSSPEEFDRLLRETETLLNVTATQSRRARALRGRALIARAFASKTAGESKRAIELARTADEFFRSDGDDFQRGRAYIVLSYVLRETGDFVGSACAAIEANRIFERLGDTSRAQLARSAEAAAHVDAGRPYEGQRIYEELLAQDLTETLRASVHHCLAVTKGRQGDIDGIEALLDRAETTPGDRQTPAFSIFIRWTRTAVAIRRGHLHDALNQLRALHAESVRDGLLRIEAELRAEMADILTALGRHEEALPHAVAALAYFAREGVAPEVKRAIAMSVVHEEQLRQASDVYRDLVRIRRTPTFDSQDPDESDEGVGE